MAPKKKGKSGARSRELHRAILTGDESQIFALSRTRPGTDPLLIGGSIVSYRKMREDPRGADITPLLVSVHFAEYDMVRYLIEEEPDLNEGLLHGMGPLALSLDYRHYEISRLLIGAGADVNLPDPEGRTPMFHAIHQDSPVAIVKDLLAAGVDKDAVIHSKKKSRPLTRAISVQNVPVVKFLLSKGADANSPTHDYTTPLNIAISFEAVEITRMLLEHGANVEGLRRADPPPLYLSVLLKENGARIIKLLIEHGADIERVFTPTRYMLTTMLILDVTALQLATMDGRPEAAAELLRAGADLEFPCPGLRRTALHLACVLDITEMEPKALERHRRMVRLLLESGANRKAKDFSEMSPTLCCYMTKNWIALEELVRAGENVNKSQKLGKVSIFSFSVKNEHETMIKLCIEYGGDCFRQPDGIRPFEAVAQAVIKRRLDHSILRPFFKHHPIDGLPQDLQTALMMSSFAMRKQYDLINAVRLDSSEALRQAIEAGADRRVFHSTMKSPVHFAASRGFNTALACLLEKVHPNSLLDAKTPLHLAAENGHLQSCLLLLAAGACYDYKDGGASALHLAKASDEDCSQVVTLLREVKRFFSLARRKDSRLFEALKKKEEDSLRLLAFLNCVNRKGNTLMSEAIRVGSGPVAEALIKLKLNVKSEQL